MGTNEEQMLAVAWLWRITDRNINDNIGVARGCSLCTRTHQGGEKIRRNLQRKFVSAPKQSKRSILRHFLLGGGDLEGSE